jgi:hypothetical protein
MSNPIIIDEAKDIDVEEFYNNILPVMHFIHIEFYFKGICFEFSVPDVPEIDVLKSACMYFEWKLSTHIDHEKYILEKVEGSDKFALVNKSSQIY